MGGICSCCPCCKKEEPRPLSPPMVRETSSDSPFSKTGMTTINPLGLIAGYENEPVVSLEEALAYFYDKIDHLSDYISEAKAKCYCPAERKLTRDESAAIYIYTMKWDNGCLYDHLQAAWESNDKLKLEPWHKYLKLFKSAFDKLPDAKGEIWQGKSYDEKLREKLKSDSHSLYVAMDVFLPSKTSMEESLENRGVKEKLLFGFESVGGKLVVDYAAFDWNGILVWPGTKLGVSDPDPTDWTGSVTYHLTGPTDLCLVPEIIKKPPIIQKEKHFMCFNNYCDHRCGRNHDLHHCHGFDTLFHPCTHHCGPTHQCVQCKKHFDNVYQCKKCESRYCKNCFNRYAMIE